MMRIIIITQYFPPDPPSWIPEGLAEELHARGHEVRVLTTFPHYATGRVPEYFRQRARYEEIRDEIRVRRVPLFASHSRNALARMMNYVSVAVSMRFARSFVEGADAAYVYATPMTVADPARAWAKSLKLPFILHVQDMWPESVTGSGFISPSLNRVVSKVIGAWLRMVYRSASGVISIAPTMNRMLVERGVRSDRAITVFNWSNDEEAGVNPSRAHKGLRLLYAGNLGSMQDVGTIIKAIAAVRDLSDVTLDIAGSGVEETRLRAEVERLSLHNVEFLGRISRAEMKRLYALADFQFVTLRALKIFDGTIPSKFQAGLVNGLPVITTVRGDLRDIVREHELGICAEPEDVTSLADAIRQAHSMPVEARMECRIRARKFYEETMSRSAAVDVIEEMLHDAIERNELAR